MNSKNGESVSVWFDQISMPQCMSLNEDIKTDVCIIGGGIAGLTTAYLLMKEGKKVCILEALELGSGQSGRTTAQFCNALDDRFYVLEKYHGEKGLQLAIQSHSEAIRKVTSIVERENIDCELEKIPGYLFSQDDDEKYVLEKEIEAAHRGGLTEVKLFKHSPLAFYDLGPNLFFPNQMQLHPVKYMRGLADVILAGGGKIFTNSPVTKIIGGENSKVITKNTSTIFCDDIVVATNTPINDKFAIHTKQAPYRSYVIGLRIPKMSVPKALFWDTLDPYHYVRVESDNISDILIVGGEDHKTGQEENPEDCYTRLEEWTRLRFPMATEVVYRWSGQVMEPVDGLAFLGHNPGSEDNVYIITGDSGNGMTHCTIGAILITDLIMKRKNEWEKLYTPSRKSFRAAKNYIQVNSNVALQYTDWIEPKFKPNFDTLEMEEGVVFRNGASMVAGYKNNAGIMEFMTAVCPHLAGVLAWNSAEKSWDCPCHGSRFDCHGKVIEGPAVTDLKMAGYHDTGHKRILEKELQAQFDKNALE
ncbi:MAG: FAD-dependent oxidoreductase [Bacteriovorax sp.]|nr:FAD-dependent oxidoreductase [Bacteriovorax sp.]